jgi:hypothetical protein
VEYRTFIDKVSVQANVIKPATKEHYSQKINQSINQTNKQKKTSVHGRMTLAPWSMNELFQTPMRPSSTGILARSGASKKWVSMSCAPARKSRTTGWYPKCRARGSAPTAEHTE